MRVVIEMASFLFGSNEVSDTLMPGTVQEAIMYTTLCLYDAPACLLVRDMT